MLVHVDDKEGPIHYILECDREKKIRQYIILLNYSFYIINLYEDHCA